MDAQHGLPPYPLLYPAQKPWASKIDGRTGRRDEEWGADHLWGRDADLAINEPQKHPRYKGFKDALGIAILTTAPDGVAAFDLQTWTTILSAKSLGTLKGDAKAGAIKVPIPESVKLIPVKSWLVTFKVEGGTVWLTGAEEASETLRLVARAAAKK